MMSSTDPEYDDYLYYDEASNLTAASARDNVTVSEPEDHFGYSVSLILTVISTFGFIGNGLSVYVLLKLRGVFSNLLTSLATYDGLFLVAAILTLGLPKLSLSYHNHVFVYILPYIYGLTHIFRLGSAYSVMSVTLERFFAIVFPFKDFGTFRKFLIPFTVVFTIVFNFPKFFELSTVYDEATGQTVVGPNKIRQNPYYVTIYLFWARFIFAEMVPYVTIIVLNSFIVFKIIKSARFRKRIAKNMQQDGTSSTTRDRENYDRQLRVWENEQKEHKLGYILMAISVLFIICQSIKIIPDLYELVYCYNKQLCHSSEWINNIVEASHLLVCTNSAANFVIYLLGGEKFRNAWISTYCVVCPCCCGECQRRLLANPRNHRGTVRGGRGGATTVTGHFSVQSSVRHNPQQTQALLAMNSYNGAQGKKKQQQQLGHTRGGYFGSQHYNDKVVLCNDSNGLVETGENGGSPTEMELSL